MRGFRKEQLERIQKNKDFSSLILSKSWKEMEEYFASDVSIGDKIGAFRVWSNGRQKPPEGYGKGLKIWLSQRVDFVLEGRTKSGDIDFDFQVNPWGLDKYKSILVRRGQKKWDLVSASTAGD